MNTTFSTKDIEEAPKEYARVRIINEARNIKRIVREGEIDWLEIGAGKADGSDGGMNERKLTILFRTIIRFAKDNGYKRIAVQFNRSPELFQDLASMTPEHTSQIAAENYEMANFEFKSFKTEPKEGWKEVEEILVCGPSTTSIEEAAKKGRHIGEAVNACRELANTPAGSMRPRDLANAAKEAVKDLPVEVTILGRAEIEKLGMGLLAGVGAGSSHEPTFTVLEYKGGEGKPIVLAGKGITFDSGGLNIKPTSGIYEMHMDMSGAAAVIYAVALAARLGLKKHVIGLVPAAENMLGDNATRPGDIHTSLSGKTVEVTDTDAEGRLVLADAITYAKQFDPSVVVDIATLTGAAHIALGDYASGLMARDESLSASLLELGEESGDYLWRLPLWDEYETTLKSEFADIQNHSIGKGRYGGASNGAIFLWQFAKELNCPWAHLDIAPRTTANEIEELARGAIGTPVRLLISFIESWNSK